MQSVFAQSLKCVCKQVKWFRPSGPDRTSCSICCIVYIWCILTLESLRPRLRCDYESKWWKVKVGKEGIENERTRDKQINYFHTSFSQTTGSAWRHIVFVLWGWCRQKVGVFNAPNIANRSVLHTRHSNYKIAALVGWDAEKDVQVVCVCSNTAGNRWGETFFNKHTTSNPTPNTQNTNMVFVWMRKAHICQNKSQPQTHTHSLIIIYKNTDKKKRPRTGRNSCLLTRAVFLLG